MTTKTFFHDEDHSMAIIQLILQTLKLLLCFYVFVVLNPFILSLVFTLSWQCLITAADRDGCAGGSVANGKTSHAGEFEGGEARPREKPPALRVIGGLRWAGDASRKISRVDTHLKCDKPENVAKSD